MAPAKIYFDDRDRDAKEVTGNYKKRFIRMYREAEQVSQAEDEERPTTSTGVASPNTGTERNDLVADEMSSDNSSTPPTSIADNYYTLKDPETGNPINVMTKPRMFFQNGTAENTYLQATLSHEALKQALLSSVISTPIPYLRRSSRKTRRPTNYFSQEKSYRSQRSVQNQQIFDEIRSRPTSGSSDSGSGNGSSTASGNGDDEIQPLQRPASSSNETNLRVVWDKIIIFRCPFCPGRWFRSEETRAHEMYHTHRGDLKYDMESGPGRNSEQKMIVIPIPAGYSPGALMPNHDRRVIFTSRKCVAELISNS